MADPRQIPLTASQLLAIATQLQSESALNTPATSVGGNTPEPMVRNDILFQSYQ